MATRTCVFCRARHLDDELGPVLQLATLLAGVDDDDPTGIY